MLNYGDVPTWLATAAAVVAGAYASRVVRIEQRRDHAADETARRAQADLVSAWAIREDQNGQPGPAVVHIRNVSSQPVFEVEVHVVYQDHPGAISTAGLETLRVLTPNEDRVIPIGDDDLREIEESWAAEGNNAAGVEMSFRDAAGRWWVRQASGQLVEDAR